MKKFVLFLVLILQFSNTPQILAQPDTLYDVFPLQKNLYYKYDYQHSHDALSGSPIDVSGTIDLRILDYYTVGDTLKIWQVEEKNILTHIIKFYNGVEDTLIYQDDYNYFTITESLIGNHLITTPSVVIFNYSFIFPGWQSHSPWSTISVERYSVVNPLTQIISRVAWFSQDTLIYYENFGLNNRTWENEWVGTSGWVDTLRVNQIGAPIVGISNEANMPSKFQLNQNYPNPFNPSTKISWQSPVSGWQTLKVFNSLGQEVETVVDEYLESGFHSKLFIVNSTLPSGVYFYRLQAGDYLETKKMILLK